MIRTAARWLGAVLVYVRRTKDDGWEPGWQPETPDIEAVRQIAWEIRIEHMHFHETAMADPFKAESILHEYAARLHKAVGFPTGTRSLEIGGEEARDA